MIGMSKCWGKTIFLIEEKGVEVSSHSHDSLSKGQGWISAVKILREQLFPNIRFKLNEYCLLLPFQ